MARPQKASNLLFLLAGIMMFSGPVIAQEFFTIDFPESTSTAPQTINNLGQVVGQYTDSGGVTHGFLLSAGVFTTIDFPGALLTVADSINNNGEIAGYYEDANKLDHGFLLNNGKFTEIDDPALPGGITGAGISDFGLIVGDGIDAAGLTHGFILNNGIFTPLDFPGATFTTPLDVNFNGSEIVGAYSLPSFPPNTTLGFTYINGIFTSVTYPESASTGLNGVNNSGLVVGTFLPVESSNVSAFLLSGNTFTIQDFPGAASTGASDLNDLGEIIGAYINFDSTVQHAYLETSGPFAYAPIRSANSVAVFDTTTTLQLPSIPVGAGPVGLGVSPTGAVVYVANYEGNSVSVINTRNSTVIATIQVGNNPLGVALTPNGAFAYVANNFSNTVSVINTDSNTVIATVPVGGIPSFVVITPDGKLVYVTNQTTFDVSVISTTTNTVVATVPLAAGPVGLAMAPNGEFVYVTVPGTDSVAVISTANNAVVGTIPVGAGPLRISITPDGTMAYVSNASSDLVSVIDLATNNVINTVTVGTTPYGSAATPDGAYDWVIDLGSNQISIISTATNTVSGTFALAGGSDIAIVSAPPTSQQLTQPLSPTQPNTFNFGTHSFGVQYPPGTNFSGVNMTVNAVEITSAQFSQRVAGTQFAGSSCIVYGGAGGNCMDYQVTCSNTSGTQITCPSEATPTIAVQTAFTTLQAIVNPGFLTTPIGENDWINIFTGFSDPLVKGRTKGFSEFVAVDLGANNPQGAGTFTIESPLRSTDPRQFAIGVPIPVTFELQSIQNPGQAVTDALASLTVEMVADSTGKAESQIVLSLLDAFHYVSGTGYVYQIGTSGFAPGTYVLTIYGNAFAAQHVQFVIVNRIATTCTIHSSSPLFSKDKSLTFTARVRPVSPTSVAATGNIAFIDSGFSLFTVGTASLTDDIASIRVVLQAPPDRQWIKAVYPGDNNFLPCQSEDIAVDYSGK